MKKSEYVYRSYRASEDLIIRPPRQPFHEVEGDHFTLCTHPEAVYEPIVAFLNEKY